MAERHSMSNRGLARWAVVGFLLSGPAAAQSVELLEAIRVHRPGLAAMTKAELTSCETAKPKSCASRERLSLLTGVFLLAEGDGQAAVQQLRAVGAPKGLEAFHGWYLGEAQSWSGARTAAVKTLQRARATAPGWLQRRIDLRSAELWLDLGLAVKAKPILEAIDDPNAEVLLSRALARHATGDLRGAKADWLSLYIHFPTHPHASSAYTRLEAEDQPLTFEQSMRRAEAQLAVAAAGAALETVHRVALPPGVSGEARDKLQARVALLRGQALLLQGKDTEAFAALDEATRGASSVAAEAMMIKARRLMRVGANPEARALFRAIDTQYPSDVNADEAGYFAAWLGLGLNDDLAAATAFADFEANHPASRRRDEARWFRGFALLRAKQFEASRRVLHSLVGDFSRSSLVPQAKYWSTRAAQLSPDVVDAGVRADVAKEYTELANAFSGTFYSVLATERLRELGVTVSAPFAIAPKAMAVKTPPLLNLAIELSRAGLLRDAAEEVRRALAQVGPGDALTFGHALQMINEFGAAHALAARFLWGAVYTAKQPEALALMYPRAYQPSVEQFATNSGIEPALAWAIMRRESAFRPEVSSPADARGLMQLMPTTAKAIALEENWPTPEPDDLYAPSTNIQLGTWYLAALLKRLGHVALCAAAYNAGPNAVLRWLNGRSAIPLDQWVEEIPYKETRGYVKQVVADLFIYEQLYGAGILPLSFALPSPKAAGVSF